MFDTLEAVKSRLGTLPSRDRAELAQFLIDSLEPESDADADGAWDLELTRRAAEIRAGRVEGKSADQVFDELRARFP